jgi:5'-3' exonuclease
LTTGPAFHAFSGCDDVSGFYGIGKKTIWNALKLVPEAIEGFKKLSCGDVAGAETVLQKLVMAMYCP